jgi:hypothetical protein
MSKNRWYKVRVCTKCFEVLWYKDWGYTGRETAKGKPVYNWVWWRWKIRGGVCQSCGGLIPGGTEHYETSVFWRPRLPWPFYYIPILGSWYGHFETRELLELRAMLDSAKPKEDVKDIPLLEDKET